MGPEGIGRAPQVLQHSQLAHAETVVHHQPHAHRHTVVACDECLQPSHVAQLQVEGIVVIAAFVLVGEERLPCILGTHDAGLHLLAVTELIAQPVAVLRPQIAFLVAFPLIEGHTPRRHQLVAAILGYLFQARRLLAVVILLVYIYKIGEQPPLRVVELTHHRQFAERLHPPVAPQISHDALHLLGREEGQFLQLLPAHAVDVHRVLLQLAQQLIGLFPCCRACILSRHHLVEILLPRACLLSLGSGKRQPIAAE